ncbi:MAG: hypothetical protein H6548_03920 [Chitinophagales bacterium]|nr:hypothetical protein [Chitinophagales bacterium]HAE12638.1 hypothetical protein [Bacteroidota bacterium]MCB9021244.1 hypothetical protein [Chitinophagales bacterium]HAE36070.1 hypothetical protein [Bacteroidota bacterium]HPE96943.1 hypothetical protein [Chitinophagales bacterium]
MKRTITFSMLFCLAMLFAWRGYVQAKEDGAPSGSTGAPGDDGTCAQVDCHTGSAVPRSGFISTDIPLAGYVPGQDYSIEVSVSSENRNTFGFQLTPQDASGIKVGSLSVTDADRTKITGLGKYITHKKNGIDGTDGMINWNFTWTAPESPTDLTFYVAVNIADGDGDATGDSIFIANLPVSADPLATAIHEMTIATKDWMTVTPGDQLMFADWVLAEQPVAEIWNLSGQHVSSFTLDEKSHSVAMLDKGMYLITIPTLYGRLTGRFIRQ